MQKDTDGGRLALQMSRPRKRRKSDPPDSIRWWDEAVKLGRLYDYCMQDVRTERAVGKKVRPLSAYERRVYLLDQKINDRGVRIDVPLVTAMTQAHTQAMEEVNAELTRLTGGTVKKVTAVRELTRWLQERGLDTNTVARPAVREMIGYADNPSDVQRVLELRMEGGRSSLAKLQRIPELINADARVRGTLLYHGASTGRWAGRLLQPHNFPRGEVPDVEKYIPLLLAGRLDEIDAPLLVVLSSLLRGTIRATPPGRLLSGDFSQIEARMVAWIAEQDDLVDAFARGAKVYEEMAQFIYSVENIDDVTKTQRQVGKNTVLGCGFQMGAARLQSQVKEQAGIDIPLVEAYTAVEAYRERNHHVVDFWYAIDRAARRAVVRPGTWHRVGRRDAIRFMRHERTLWCVLPSGRPLAYIDPRIEVEKDSDRTNVVVSARDSFTKQWRRQRMYGGFWTENVVQAMARDVMVAGMMQLEAAGYPIVMTVHDEVVADTGLAKLGPAYRGTLEQFLHILKRGPSWAHDLPIAVEGWEGKRYRK
jgi:DNA polymerase